MTVDEIMGLVCDYADAFANRKECLGEVDAETMRMLRKTQLDIGLNIKKALIELNDTSDVVYNTSLTNQEGTNMTQAYIKKFGSITETSGGQLLIQGFQVDGTTNLSTHNILLTLIIQRLQAELKTQNAVEDMTRTNELRLNHGTLEQKWIKKPPEGIEYEWRTVSAAPYQYEIHW